MPPTDEKVKYYVGVDFGGTKIYAGVFSAGLKCIGSARNSTKAERGPEAVIERIARCIEEAVDECDLSLENIRGVGIGAPGAVEAASGRVIFAPNLDWKDVPLKKDLEKALKLPVFVGNDCDVCMTGVYEVELDGKPQHAVGIFIGTGIGAGLVLNGERYRGFNRTGGEIGHMVLQADGPKCGCGNRGCFEALASRSAIFRMIHDAVKEGQETLLTEMLGKDLDDMRSGDLRKAIRRGDTFVAKEVQEAARYTGLAVGNIINLLNPEIIVLGGGVIEALEEQMMPTITKVAEDCALAGTAKGVKIVASKLADEAGIVGGAVVARRETK